MVKRFAWTVGPGCVCVRRCEAMCGPAINQLILREKDGSVSFLISFLRHAPCPREPRARPVPARQAAVTAAAFTSSPTWPSYWAKLSANIATSRSSVSRPRRATTAAAPGSKRANV